MNPIDQEYTRLLREILLYGKKSEDRTGTGTIRRAGVSLRFPLETYPVLSTKKILFYPMLIELLWFLQGKTDLKWLQDRKCNIWNQWHFEDNTIGKGYGYQWRKWNSDPSTDQLKEVINKLKTDPNSRRNILTAWNPQELNEMALPPCHMMSQFLVIEGKLNCILTQRSGDAFLGIPFNIASYGLLTILLAKECDLEPGELIHNIGDAHIYLNHIDQVKEQLSRSHKKAADISIDESIFEKGLLYWIDNILPNLSLEEIKNLIKLENYDPHPFIKAEVAV